MADRVEIRFVDENDFVKRREMVFIEREFTVGDKPYTMRTSGLTEFRFRLKLKITCVESAYPSQRPNCPSLSPYFLLELLDTQVIPVRSVEACTFHAQRIQTSPEAGKLWP